MDFPSLSNGALEIYPPYSVSYLVPFGFSITQPAGRFFSVGRQLQKTHVEDRKRTKHGLGQ